MSKLSDLLHRHVDHYNHGVDTGDWGPMVDSFDENGEMHFEGPEPAQYKGRGAIADAYAKRPPDDHIDIISSEERGGGIVARYRWRNGGSDPAGEMHLVPGRDDPDKVAKLVVTFQQGLG
jgi:SnoaL-like protein